VEAWPVNWEVALENSMDAHVPYLHMNAWWVALMVGFGPFGAAGGHVPVWTGNGFSGERTVAPTVAYFPSVGSRWPKTNYRRLWTWMFRWYLMRNRRTRQLNSAPRWTWGHHLPGMFRSGNPIFDHYTRMCVPVDEHHSRVWYYHSMPARTWWQRLLHTLEYKLYVRKLHDDQFSKQDVDPMLNQRYDTPEKLSGTDAEVVQWRRLIVTKHFGGRNAPFRFNGKSLVGREGLADEEAEFMELDGERTRAAVELDTFAPAAG
jgi:hypothetical protein